jgi:hypothetical protein
MTRTTEGWNDVLVYEPDSPGESWWDWYLATP